MYLYLSEKIKNYYFNNETYYSMIDLNQFISYFLPKKHDYIISNFENADICVWNMELNNNVDLNNNKNNILISIENINYWAKYKKNLDWPGYIHYSKYYEFDDEKINIYFYNHIHKLIKNEKYLAIPMLYIYIDYFLLNNYKIYPLIEIPFENKNFCLVINKSNLNKDIKHITSKISFLGDIDNISLYNDILSNKSCYHSQELINVFNKYKFILCIENSYDDNYITEKIFNCFYSKSIPLYKGSNIINTYINQESFINLKDDNFTDTIQKILNNKDLYYNYINNNKINYNYNNENFHEEYISYIEKKIKLLN
tara:strand:- start:1026 stop:1961 length:936 start_codon:yes stop_codon:yes gene_type:complete